MQDKLTPYILGMCVDYTTFANTFLNEIGIYSCLLNIWHKTDQFGKKAPYVNKKIFFIHFYPITF